MVNNLAVAVGVLPYSSSPKSLRVAKNNRVSGGGDDAEPFDAVVGLHILSFFVASIAFSKSVVQ